MYHKSDHARHTLVVRRSFFFGSASQAPQAELLKLLKLLTQAPQARAHVKGGVPRRSPRIDPTLGSYILGLPKALEQRQALSDF